MSNRDLFTELSSALVEAKQHSEGKLTLKTHEVNDISELNIIARTHKSINSAAICDLLLAIRRKNPSEDKMYVILDGSGYNMARETKEFARSIGIKLVYLPPYSPNLNPIERLWIFMKKSIIILIIYLKI